MRKLLIALLVLGCQRAQEQLFTESVRFARQDTLLAYSRAQTFVPMLGDSQRLMLGSYPTGRYGPRVQISPEMRSYAHTRDELVQGEHLLARLVNFDNIAYPKLNLAPFDTVYIWTTTGQGGTGGPPNALFISTLTNTRIDAGIQYHAAPPGFRASQAAARFLWTDEDETTCMLCQWAEWCRIQ